MVILIPFSHDELVVSRLPFATIAMILLCAIIFFPTSSRFDADVEAELQALTAIANHEIRNPHLMLPDAMLPKVDPARRQLEKNKREWLEWYRNAPGEVTEFLEQQAKRRTINKGTKFINLLEGMGGVPSGLAGEVASEGLSVDARKADYLTRVRQVGLADLEAQQRQMDELYARYEEVSQGALVRRFGFVPDDFNVIGLVTHQFLHGGVFHLLFNMLFLWLAAVRLEDIWPRGLFVGAYLLFGIIGALCHAAAHPDSTIPMVGASGAVAGLMGVFLIRLGRTRIHFWYAYWLFRLTPRTGTFAAPAYFMLPLWFAGELTYALFFDIGIVAYWAHVGGFLAGVGLAVAFKLTDFEYKVLGLMPDEPAPDPDQMPLIAFREQGQLPETPEASASRRPVGDPAPAAAAAPASTPAEPGAPLAEVPAPAAEGTVPLAAAAVGAAAVGFAAANQRPEPGACRLELDELRLTRIDANGSLGQLVGGGKATVPGSDVAFLIPAMVDEIDPASGGELFPVGMPASPAHLLLLLGPLVAGPHLSLARGYIIDGAKLDYTALFPEVLPSPDQNLAALAKVCLRAYPHAVYVHGPGPLGPHNLPRYETLAQLTDHLREYIVTV